MSAALTLRWSRPNSQLVLRWNGPSARTAPALPAAKMPRARALARVVPGPPGPVANAAEISRTIEAGLATRGVTGTVNFLQAYKEAST